MSDIFFAEHYHNRQIQRKKSDMLSTLRIRNLALVEDLTLELEPGYVVITGETGAGKSILIGALNLVLGGRADRTLIRSGSDSCSVEAAFDINGLKMPLDTWLEENGLEPCAEGQLLLRRSLQASGTNRQFINGSPASLGLLSSLGEWLVDFHGPHEHQSLLHPPRQLDILDAFGQLEPHREHVATLVRERAALQQELAGLITDDKTHAQQIDLLRHQSSEIAAARLQPGEEETLTADYNRVSNAARLVQLAQAGLDLLAEADGALLNVSATLGRTLNDLHRVDPAAADLVAQHQAAAAGLQELQAALSRYLDRIEVDPSRLHELEERLNLVHSLKRKYGATVQEVLAFGEQARSRLQALEGRDSEVARIKTALTKAESALNAQARKLTEARRKVIPNLAKAAGRQLADLGFKQSRFEITLSESETVTRSGRDAIEFQFAPNPGEPPRPLRAIASSGELARVMLALKTVLAAQDQVPVLIFDEVDANVGGETAHAVGAKLKAVAARRQVLCISHLAQVAAPATAHFLVSKHTRAGRTVSEIELLDRSSRVQELARMLGGQSQAALRHAEELLSTQAP